ncbi:MAG: hypothetical protein R2696_10905 [Microthrixaceae bacterium]
MREHSVSTVQSIDEQVLELRAEGWSFARIADQLELPRATEAQDRFLLALATSPSGVRNRIRKGELTRLGQLADRIRCRPTLDEVERERLLDAVAHLADVVRRS